MSTESTKFAFKNAIHNDLTELWQLGKLQQIHHWQALNITTSDLSQPTWHILVT